MSRDWASYYNKGSGKSSAWTGLVQSPASDLAARPPWLPQQSLAVAAALEALAARAAAEQAQLEAQREQARQREAQREKARQQEAQLRATQRQEALQRKAQQLEDERKAQLLEDERMKRVAPTSAPASAGGCDASQDASEFPPDRNRVRSAQGYIKARARDAARYEAYKARKGKGKGKGGKPSAPSSAGQGKGGKPSAPSSAGQGKADKPTGTVPAEEKPAEEEEPVSEVDWD